MVSFNQFSMKEHLNILLDNIRKNADVIDGCPAVDEYAGKYSGRPAVVVGVGPSLEKNARLLNDYEKAVVFVCDRARDSLKKLGVRYDFVVTTDPKPVTASFISEPGVKDETLLASIYAPSEILALPWKQVVFYNTADDDGSYMAQVRSLVGHVALIPGGLVVSNFAFLLAEYMDCSQIAFAGVDFSSPEPEPGWIGLDDYIHLKLSDGRKYHTLKSFLLALDWLDGYILIRRMRQGFPPVYNCTEGGVLYSDSIKPMELKVFLDRFA